MQVLITPVITEKSLKSTADGRYVFQVAKNATKASIAHAVEDLYKVDVTCVNVINIKGKERLVRGRFLSKQRDWKKAVITLKKGQKIPGFEQ